ncbi:MAG: ATP F0F1 synthase subunit B [Cyanobacteria bacterium P01_E01_bin.6]
MLIDPVIVLAQIINFLILVVLLKHFLYGPITRAMTQRQQTIVTQLEKAEQQQQKAQQEAARLHRLQQDFVAHQDQRMTQLRSQIEEQRRILSAKARAEIDAAKVRWYQGLEQEKSTVLRVLRQQTAYQLIQTVHQILTDLADTTLEQQIAHTFLQHLRQLSASEQDLLRTALSQSDDTPIVIYSSFPLEEMTQQTLTQAVQALTEHSIKSLQFNVDTELGCGILLKLPGYKLDWNLAAYLDRLEHTLAHILDQRSAPVNT